MHTDYLVDIQNADLYRGEEVVLRNVSFNLAPGEFSYIFGKTGTGKSSFLKSLYGIGTYHTGKAVVLGEDLKTLSLEKLPYFRRKLGMVFQDASLFEEWTAEENLDFVLRATDWRDEDDRRVRIKQILKQIGLTKVRRKVIELSAGEKHALAFGRAILNKPKLILCDEPTGNLDSDNTHRIMSLMIDLAREYKASIILSTHDQMLLRDYPARKYLCEQSTLTLQEGIGLPF